MAALAILILVGANHWLDKRQAIGPTEPQFSISDPESMWVVVNKNRPISKSYSPSDLQAPEVKLRHPASNPNMQLRSEAASALEDLFEAASGDGHELMVGSAYRSYKTQSATYQAYVTTLGAKEANKVSAKPGTSEHQTGWAVDVAPADWKCFLETCFGDLPAGKWVASNAHDFGFIVRYLEDKAKITGYNYEPWHLRYVGKDLSDLLYSSGQTMEEHFSL